MATKGGKGAKDDWAVIVGIQHYPGLKDNRLLAPESDAVEFRNWVLAEGQVPPEHVLEVLTSKYKPKAKVARKAHPTPDEITSSFRQVFAQVRKAVSGGKRRGRRLYIFCAGHGVEQAGFGPSILSADTDQEVNVSSIAARAFADYFRDNRLFDEVLLFVDCCRESLQHGAVIGPSSFPPFNNFGAEPTKWFYGFAARTSQLAREATIDGKPRGVFTAALLEGLRGARAEPDGRITSRSLSDYIHERVPELLKQVDAAEGEDDDHTREERQSPDIDLDSNQAAAFVIHQVRPKVQEPGAPPRFPVTLRLKGKESQQKLEVYGKTPAGLRAVWAASEPAEVQHLALPNGRYSVVLDDEPAGVFDVDDHPTTWSHGAKP